MIKVAISGTGLFVPSQTISRRLIGVVCQRLRGDIALQTTPLRFPAARFKRCSPPARRSLKAHRLSNDAM